MGDHERLACELRNFYARHISSQISTEVVKSMKEMKSMT